MSNLANKKLQVEGGEKTRIICKIWGRTVYKDTGKSDILANKGRTLSGV